MEVHELETRVHSTVCQPTLKLLWWTWCQVRHTPFGLTPAATLGRVHDTQSLDAAAVPAFVASTYLMFAAVMYRAADRPDTRPNTTQSRRELPPRRLLPWM